MIRKIFIAVFSCIAISSSIAQSDINLELVSEVSLEGSETGNDIWGYVDDNGIEYAILGTTRNTKIYSLEDPTQPEEIAVIPGSVSVWRDMKVYKNHIYVTTDQGSDGLLIIDMTVPIRDSISHVFWKPTLTIGDQSQTLRTCHNIYIDTIQGYGYLSGCNISNQGVLIIKLEEDGSLPTHVGEADLAYSHDAYVLDDILYSSEINIGQLGIYDISDKTNPVLLATQVTTTFFTHNAWTSEDGKYIFTTDERPNAFVDAYDISDLNDIRLVDKYQPLETASTGVIPHNTHYKDGFIYTSWYTDGLIITDVNDPSNMVQVAAYDTHDGNGTGFNGCWGAYPFLPSGLILASDMQRGLFVFQPKLNNGANGVQRASYLTGTATDVNTGEVISNVKVEILSEKMNESITDLNGQYKTGLVYSGTHQVVFSHPNYTADTLTVDLISGEYVTLDVSLGGLLVSGLVVDAEGSAIPNAKIVMINTASGGETIVTSNENGRFSNTISGSATYQLLVAAWGYRSKELEIQGIGEVPNIVLEEGYEDDFFVDLGWTTTSTASSGDWELGNPEFTTFNGSTIITDSDVPNDKGNLCYLTETNQGNLGNNDIDNGTVTLISPFMDFTSQNKAVVHLSYHYIFLENEVGFDDRLTISIENGNESYSLLNLEDVTASWTRGNFEFTTNDITFTENMRLVITASDEGDPHFTEAQIDHLFVELSFDPELSTSLILENELSIYPNPSNNMITIDYNSADHHIEYVDIIQWDGKHILHKKVQDHAIQIDLTQFPSGVYMAKVVDDEGAAILKRIVKL